MHRVGSRLSDNEWWVRGAALEFLISASHVIYLLHAVIALLPAVPPQSRFLQPLNTTDPFIPIVIVPPLHDSDSSVMPVKK